MYNSWVPYIIVWSPRIAGSSSKNSKIFFLIVNVILPSIYCWIYFSQENDHNIYKLGCLLVWLLCLCQCNCEFGQCYYFNLVLCVFAAAELMLSSDIVVSLKLLVLICCLIELTAFLQIFKLNWVTTAQVCLSSPAASVLDIIKFRVFSVFSEFYIAKWGFW